jgi:hypothetical protein
MTCEYRRIGPHPDNVPGAIIAVETPSGAGTRYVQLRLTCTLAPEALELAFRGLERELHPEEETPHLTELTGAERKLIIYALREQAMKYRGPSATDPRSADIVTRSTDLANRLSAPREENT